MQIAAGSSILEAVAADAAKPRPQPRDTVSSASRQATWLAPATIGRGRLIDLVV
jgi:hypothetical protein